MHVSLARRTADKMPQRIESLNRLNWIDRIPAYKLRRAVLAANLGILVIVVAGVVGWL